MREAMSLIECASTPTSSGMLPSSRALAGEHPHPQAHHEDGERVLPGRAVAMPLLAVLAAHRVHRGGHREAGEQDGEAEPRREPPVQARAHVAVERHAIAPALPVMPAMPLLPAPGRARRAMSFRTVAPTAMSTAVLHSAALESM